jgi:hypothetical protein
MNKLAHGIVLVFFAAACGLLSLLLKLPPMVAETIGGRTALPAFTRLLMSIGPIVVLALVLTAAAYCFWVWLTKKTEPPRGSWVAFLATATGSLFLFTLPVIVALYLPVVSALHNLSR